MRERDARRIILFLLVLVIFSIGRNAILLTSQHQDLVENTSHILTPKQPAVQALKNNDSSHNATQSLKEQVTRNSATVNTAKPYFILHVGPPKTATTTIQCGLEEISEELANEDSYYFVGKRCPKYSGPMANGEKGIPGHHLMMGLNSANPHSRGFEKLKNRTDFHRSHGHHMIFSIEAMSNHLEDNKETWDLFLSLLEGWNVRVVVAYRHYFDWIRSMYFQQHIGSRFHKWPHENGQIQPSFHTYLSYHLGRWQNNTPSNDGFSWGQHLTLSAYQYFAGHFEDVRIFNLHQDGDVLTNFVCQMLPTARNTCKRLERQNQGLNETIVKRVSQSFDAERLAIAAYEKDLLNKKASLVSRRTVVKKIEDRIERTAISSKTEYMACLPELVEARFRNASLWFERKVVEAQRRRQPKIHYEHDAESQTSLFDQANAKGKFCEIDPEPVLQNEHWRTFLSEIKGK